MNENTPSGNELDHSIINNILNDYFPSLEFSYKRISGGLTNFNYHVHVKQQPGNAQKEYFLKVFRTTDVKRIQGMIALNTLLEKRSFPIPALISRPIQNDASHLLPDIRLEPYKHKYWNQGKHTAIISEYIHGKIPGQNTENLHLIGNLMGALHLISPGEDEKPYLLDGYSLNYENQKEKLTGKSLPEDLAGFLDKFEKILPSIDFKELHKSVIHGDVFLDNVLMTPMKDLYFVDFEGGCIEISLFDVARTMLGCCVKNRRFNPELCRAFLSGYHLFRPPSPPEHEQLYEFIVYTGAVSVLWRFNEFYLGRWGENRQNIYKELLEPVARVLEEGKSATRRNLLLY